MKLIVITLIFFFNCNVFAQNTKLKTITVNPYLAFQNYEHFKRLILSSDVASLESIEGFEFEWGNSYTLIVKQIKLNSELSDGTKYKYVFEKLLDKTREPDTSQFKMFLDANRYYYEVDSSEEEVNKTFSQIDDSTFTYFDRVKIQVPVFLMDEFKLIVDGKKTQMGTFGYIDEKRIRLVEL